MTYLFLKLDTLFPFRIVFADVISEIERFNEWYSTSFDPQLTAEMFIEWRHGIQA